MFGNLARATALLLCCVAAMASAATVGEVKFDQKGGNPLQPELLMGNIQLQPGVTFSRRALDEDVKRLYATGNFADVVAEESAQGDKVDILFKVRLKPRVVSIRFEGNAKYQAFELGKEITLVEGGLLKDKNYVESRDKLLDFYRKKGYTEATVTPVIMPRSGTEVDLLFKIDEKLKQKIDKVTFEGATVYSERELRGAIANQYSYWNWLPFVNDYLNHGLLDRRELALDRARLREKYYDKGYLDFKIDDVTVTRQADDPEYVDIAFKVTEGEPYKVGKITVKGNSAFAESELMPLVLLAAGTVFSSELEQESARRITSNYETLGYSDISCRANRHADYNTHTVDVEFEIVEGRKFFVRDVLISGNTYTKDKVIRRELAIEPGDPADKNRIEVSRQRLMGMGYFDKVEARAVGADALDEKDVVFDVKEKEDRYKLRFGAGASDVNSVFGMAEISTDNFDILDPYNWFYGGGQRFRVQGVLGIDNAGFNVDFVEPWLFDLPLRFEASSYMNRVVYENWDETRIGFRTSLSRKFFDNFTSATIGYKFERVNLTDIAHSIRPYMEANDQLDPQFVSQPSLSLTRDTRNSITNPTSGYNINLFGSITPKALGSSNDYYRLEAKGSCYYSFFDEAIVSMVGARIGTVSSFDRNESVPIFERYFLGGTGSVRGFEYRSISPVTDEHEDNIGGQTMLVATAEISHPIWGPLRGVAFIDAGNAWRNSYSMGFSGINAGAGYGIRMMLPQINAPLELDLAYPIINNQDGASSRFRVHFNVGMGLSF